MTMLGLRLGAGVLGLAALAAAASPGPGAQPVRSAPSLQPVGAMITGAARLDAAPRAARASAPRPAAPVFRGRDGEAITAARIRRFLVARGSPMAPYATAIVRAGIRYRMDPRTVVAIAGVESTFGLYRYGFNAWGWGDARWSSWPEAIAAYTRSLSAAYPSLRHGDFLTAARRYAPPSWRTWAGKSRAYFRLI